MKISLKLLLVYFVFLLTLYNIVAIVFGKYGEDMLKKLGGMGEKKNAGADGSGKEGGGDEDGDDKPASEEDGNESQEENDRNNNEKMASGQNDSGQNASWDGVYKDKAPLLVDKKSRARDNMHKHIVSLYEKDARSNLLRGVLS